MKFIRFYLICYLIITPINLLAAVFAVESLDAARGINKLLLAGVERMASGADVDTEVTAGGERVVNVSTSAGDLGRLVVRVVGGGLHLLPRRFAQEFLYLCPRGHRAETYIRNPQADP